MWAFYQALGVQGLELLAMVRFWRNRTTSESMLQSMATLTSDAVTAVPDSLPEDFMGPVCPVA
jgi:hypothetical protein